MNYNCQMPNMSNSVLASAGYCNACDMFPVDMGIDVGPLQARINECKRRYHREIWRILCDGAETELKSQKPKKKKKSPPKTNTDSAEEDKELPGNDEQSENENNYAESWMRRPQRTGNNVADKVGRVDGGGKVWSPIDAELQKLHQSLAAAAKLAATAISRSEVRDRRGRHRQRQKRDDDSKSISTTTTPTTKTTPTIKKILTTETNYASKSTKKNQGHTLVVKLSVDAAKQTVSGRSGSVSFQTDLTTAPTRVRTSFSGLPKLVTVNGEPSATKSIASSSSSSTRSQTGLSSCGVNSSGGNTKGRRSSEHQTAEASNALAQNTWEEESARLGES